VIILILFVEVLETIYGDEFTHFIDVSSIWSENVRVYPLADEEYSRIERACP
jgi:hypothetical protein